MSAARNCRATAAGDGGEWATVEGPVVGTKFADDTRGRPTFLNLGEAYPSPDRFTVVIWGRRRFAFDGKPEEIYRGKTIRVTGTIKSYRGVPQIEVDGPGDIKEYG